MLAALSYRRRYIVPILIQCPNPVCATSSSVPEALNGRGVKCKRCGTPFKATPTLDGESNETQKSKPNSSGNPFPILPAKFDRYHVTKLLGRGGMGAVYLALDTQLGRQVALKLPSFDASDTRRVERFVREAQAAAGLMHPNICPVFDAGKIDGRPFITMGYIDGNSLDSLIDPDAPMGQIRAVGFARKVAAALHAAHETGIVHRDLKPANVMLTAKGEPVVMDFGLAKRIAETDTNEAKLTHDGAVMGTPSYMAPEQVRGELKRIGPATDVYSLGVMLFEMLTGRTPYTGPLGMVMGQILIAPVRRPSELRPDIDPQLDDACHKAMAKEPAHRFPNMVAFGAALDAVLKGPDPTPEAPKMPLWKPPSRLPLSIAAGFLCLMLLVGGIMLSVKTKYGDVVIDLGENVAGVEVKVDGARVELTGIDKPIMLTAGEHGLTITGADFETVTQSFTVKKDEKQLVKVTLKPKAAAAVVPAPKVAEVLTPLLNEKDRAGLARAKNAPLVNNVETKADGIAKLTAALLDHTWNYRDNLFPPGEKFRFNNNGTFHSWKWKYWVVGPRTIRVHYDKNNNDKDTGIEFAFTADLSSFKGEFSDPNGRKHFISGFKD